MQFIIEAFDAISSGLRKCLCSTVVLLLCACGGAGTQDSDQLSALQERQRATNQLIASFSPIEYTELNTIPTSGSALYQGFVSGQFSNTDDDITDTLIGDLSLQVVFDAPEMVSGSVGNFLDDRGNSMSGSLVLSGGVLDRGGDPDIDATFTFDGSGDIIDNGGRSISVTAAFAGDFLKDGYTGVGGDVQGQAIVNGLSQSFGGLFIASQ